MPCLSDHMGRNAREAESVRVINHLNFLAEHLDDFPWDPINPGYYGRLDDLDTHTAHLCAQLHIYEALAPPPLWEKLNAIDIQRALSLRAWWESHKAADRKREAQERAEAEIQEAEDRETFERLRAKYNW